MICKCRHEYISHLFLSGDEAFECRCGVKYCRCKGFSNADAEKLADGTLDARRAYYAERLEMLEEIKRIEEGLRLAPRKLTPGGVLVAEILDDTMSSWITVLRELISDAQWCACDPDSLVNIQSGICMRCDKPRVKR